MSPSHGSTRITMVGHSTVLFEMGGLRILTDPYFGRHGNPAYRRIAPPSAPRERLADVSLVLLTHDHWDHFDRPFFRLLPSTTPVLVPHGARAWMRLLGVRQALGIRPWESVRQGGVTIWRVPARHSAIACGYVLEHGRQRVYFAGDTFHGPFHERIARELAPSIALLPVTTYRLPMTMGESSAVRAVRALGCQVVVPIHLGLEPRSPLMRTGQSVEGFTERLREAVPTARVVHLREGESWEATAGEEPATRATRVGAPATERAGATGAAKGNAPEPAKVGETTARPASEPPGAAASDRAPHTERVRPEAAPPAVAPAPRPAPRRLAPLVVRMIGRRDDVDRRLESMQDAAERSGQAAASEALPPGP